MNFEIVDVDMGLVSELEEARVLVREIDGSFRCSTRAKNLLIRYGLLSKIEQSTNFLGDTVALRERLYCYVNNIKEMVVCPVCKKRVSFGSFTTGYDTYCSKSCKCKVESPWKSHSDEFPELMRQANLGQKRSEEHRKNLTLALVRRYGNPEQRRKTGVTTRQRWNRPEYRDKLSKAISNAFSDDMKREKSEMFKAMWNNPHYKKMFLENGKLHGGFGNSGWHRSPKVGDVFYRSSWEQNAYVYLDNNPLVLRYFSEPFFIPYDYEGRIRNYYPDLLIEYIDKSLEIVEIKPRYKLSDESTRVKLKAGCAYAKEHSVGFKVWTETNWPTGAFNRTTKSL